jgi:membrane-associated protease RseP (regulator of RpoE activity)
LFLACCVSTYLVGGLTYSVAVMGILLCHELGHYVQARRYHVPASLPYFIPFPFSPIGTMGAVIAMRGHMGSRKALYDIGISGPLAGLVPTIICCMIGISWSYVGEIPKGPGLASLQFGEPLLFKWMTRWYFGPLSEGQTVFIHPLGFAGWVGMFITALNLIPIGQLDGGHVLYAMIGRRAHTVAYVLIAVAIGFMVYSGYYAFILMLMLLMLMGPKHPPTANDRVPLGTVRYVLGWLALAFILIGFTPMPITQG